MNLTCIGYYVMGSEDLDAWERLCVDVLGLQTGKREDGLLTLRMDEYVHRFIVEKDATEDFLAAGWEFDNEEKLERFVQNAIKNGASIIDGGEELAERRKVRKVYFCEDPNGFRHEFYCGLTLASWEEPFQSKVLTTFGFVTGRLGIGHIVPAAKNYKETLSFYCNVLGLRVSDYVRLPVGESVFLHTLNGRHHSIATLEINWPKRLRHLSIEVQDVMDLGVIYERARRAGVLGREIGLHTNDRALTFYVKTPSGYLLEIAWGGIVIDDSVWKIRTYTEASVFGHGGVQ